MRKDFRDCVWPQIALLQLAPFGLFAGKILLQYHLVDLEPLWLGMLLVIVLFLLQLCYQDVLLCCL